MVQSGAIERACPVEYQLEDADLEVLYGRLFFGKQQSISLGKLLISWGIIIPMIPFAGFLVHRRFDDPDVWIGYLLAASFGFLMVWQVWKTRQKGLHHWLLTPEVQGRKQTMTIELRRAGFAYRSDDSYGLIGWQNVTRIETTDCHRLLLWCGEGEAAIIPQRAFPTAPDFERFVETARDLHTAAVRQVCQRCGYDLRAAPDGCPECGWLREIV
jgi:hypothetical protein